LLQTLSIDRQVAGEIEMLSELIREFFHVFRTVGNKGDFTDSMGFVLISSNV
jgi:hypothetical protein